MKHRPFRGIVHSTVPIGPQGVSVSFPANIARLEELAKKVENNTLSQYIIWNPTSNLTPKVIQPDRQTAIKVAGRMAHENPGQTFYVCKLTNSAVKPIPVDVKYEDLDR